ncbi:MAG: hypothetical protein KDD65_08400, partial [Bacteroidetes bacterium]|nr:hypothetical protein [Bacteroidota bacterium]
RFPALFLSALEHPGAASKSTFQPCTGIYDPRIPGIISFSPRAPRLRKHLPKRLKEIQPGSFLWFFLLRSKERTKP